jgi:hypothetical protein
VGLLTDETLKGFCQLGGDGNLQVDALAQLLIEEGIITQEKFFTKLKQVQASYQKNDPTE